MPNSSPEPACHASRFERTPEGFIWHVGTAALPFRAWHEAEETDRFNYRRRTAHIAYVDDPSVKISSDAYAETDCGAEPDDDGNEVWCLSSNGLVGESSLFRLVQAHRPCESGLELLEAFAMHSSAPTAFRVGLPMDQGFFHEMLGFLGESMAAEGIPQTAIDEVNAHAQRAVDADSGYRRPEDDALAIAALDDARGVLAPFLAQESAWHADVLAARALAKLRRRYPATQVGPRETLYDVVEPDADPPRRVPTPAPWSGR